MESIPGQANPDLNPATEQAVDLPVPEVVTQQGPSIQPAVEEHAGFVRTFGACAGGLVVPGLGHAILGKWDRALVFLASISCMFAFGLYLDGRLFGPDFSDAFGILKFLADAGTGSLYWFSWLRGLGGGAPATYTYDFGNVFLYTAGLLNMLVVVDAFDIGLGRKP